MRKLRLKDDKLSFLTDKQQSQDSNPCLSGSKGHMPHYALWSWWKVPSALESGWFIRYMTQADLFMPSTGIRWFRKKLLLLLLLWGYRALCGTSSWMWNTHWHLGNSISCYCLDRVKSRKQEIQEYTSRKFCIGLMLKRKEPLFWNH